MITIIRKGDQAYNLREDGWELLNRDFYLIKQVHHDSCYYCLYIDENSFILYDSDDTKRKFFQVENRLTEDPNIATVFEEDVDHYSETTKTFVLHLKENDRVCLIKERSNNCVVDDGGYMCFRYVGPESENQDRSRPVQKCDGRWHYINCKGFLKYAWAEKGTYDFNDTEGLGPRFNDDFFSVKNFGTGLLKLAFYDRGKRRRVQYYPNEYKEIREFGRHYLLCKLPNNNLRSLYYKRTKQVITSFCEDPRQIEEGYLRLKSEDSQKWFLLRRRDAKIIENINWTSDKEIIVSGNYVFHGLNGCGWRIYSIKDGNEIYTGWQIIQITTDSRGRIHLRGNYGEQIGVELSIDGIEQAQSHFLESLSSRGKVRGRGNTDEPDAPEMHTQENQPAPLGSDAHNRVRNIDGEFGDLPDRIDFICKMDKVKKANVNHILCSRRPDGLSSGNNILFIDSTDFALYCCRYEFKSYRILWHKVGVRATQRLVELVSPNGFSKIDLIIHPDVDVIEQVERELSRKSQEKEELIKNNLIEREIERYNIVRAYLTSLKFDEESIQKALDILLPSAVGAIKPSESNCVEFTYDGQLYRLGTDNRNMCWCVSNPFERRRFIRKSDAVFVLIDRSEFVECHEDLGYDYIMRGEGKDERYDQDIEGQNANSDISRKQKRILLFKQETHKDVRNPLLYLFDEVEYVGHSFIREDGGFGRRVIEFHLKSLFRKRSKA